ncbi:alginate lyase family protein [Cetobacterium sp.]
MVEKNEYNLSEILNMKADLKNNSILKYQFLNLKQEIDNKILTLKYSVVDKELLPHGSNKNDYYSIGIYAWPNKNSIDGIPWTLDDCKANPYVKTYATDSIRIENFCNDIMILTTLFLIYEDHSYLDKIEELLVIWFIDENTKMNPHMNYAQAIPGICSGRGIGLIDARHFIKLIDYLSILDKKKLIDSTILRELKVWFSDFILWMENSVNGKEEEQALNNHGSWYEAELTTFARFVEDYDKVLSRKDIFINKVTAQFEENGNQPYEVKRKKAWHYFIFNLEAIFISYRNIESIQASSLSNIKEILKNSSSFMLNKMEFLNTWENKEDLDFFDDILRTKKILPIFNEMSKENIFSNAKINNLKNIYNITDLELLFNTQNDYIVLFK